MSVSDIITIACGAIAVLMWPVGMAYFAWRDWRGKKTRRHSGIESMHGLDGSSEDIG